MKDFLLRKDGLEKIKQKQFQEEKEMKSQEQVPYQPEFKKFFKNEQVQVDLREQTKIHQNFLEQKLREELLKSLYAPPSTPAFSSSFGAQPPCSPWPAQM